MHVTHLHRSCALIVVLLLAIGLSGCHSGAERDVVPTAIAPAAAVVSQSGLLGDLNGSETPDVADAIGILRIVVGLDADNPLADCDGDGTVGVADAIMLLRCVVGLGEWPIGGDGHNLGDEMTGPDGQTLVWVPGGSLMMGRDDGWPDEQPVHQVTLDGFWIGQCEVTNAQYRAFCTATGHTFPDYTSWYPYQGDDHPVVYVSWDDAQAYCDHYGYALPTEAQWEYASRGPGALQFPWGHSWDLWKCCNYFNTGPGGYTFPVGSFPAGASWCGALDMAGNVWEWCADWYSDTYYQISPELNPPGPGSGSYRVVRGGSWSLDLPRDGVHAASRGNYDPSRRSGNFGFRCSRGL